MMNFHHFVDIQNTININKGFKILKKYLFVKKITFFKNDIILQMGLGLLIKIYKFCKFKSFLKNLKLHVMNNLIFLLV
jgi:hypothetical protein